MKLPGPRQYPKEIHIKDEVWRLKFKKIVAGDWKHLACTYPDKLEIHIKMGLSRDKIFRCFIHECLHVIENTYDFDIIEEGNHVFGDKIYKLEEGIVDILFNNF